MEWYGADSVKTCHGCRESRYVIDAESQICYGCRESRCVTDTVETVSRSVRDLKICERPTLDM